MAAAKSTKPTVIRRARRRHSRRRTPRAFGGSADPAGGHAGAARASAPPAARRPVPGPRRPGGGGGAVVALLHAPAELAPVRSVLDAMRARHGVEVVRGLVPGLVVHDPVGWLPATRLADGSALPEVLSAARRRWGGSRHASAALAWKSYTYWVALPAVVGYALTRRVPDMSPEQVLVRPHGEAPF